MKNKHVASLCLLLLPFQLATRSPQSPIQTAPAAASSVPAAASSALPPTSPAPPTDTTYADRLGFPRGARVLILHVDDAGMSFESNEGAIAALTKGAATSVSVMMPCPWVPGFVKWLKDHPDIDAGLHLTLTSEWPDYRWRPVSGQPISGQPISGQPISGQPVSGQPISGQQPATTHQPGLADSTGNLWATVEEVARHATPGEIATEISAQLNRARTMGFEPTHLDTHMGTVYATPEFLKKYLQAGITNHVPVMLPGGADKLIQQQTGSSDAQIANLRALGTMLWNAGLPVLDDLHNFSYDWKVPDSLSTTDPTPASDKRLQKWRTAKYIDALHTLRPGVTMMIMHCTDAGAHFTHISDSGPLRRGDMLAMLDPEFKRALREEGIILTTWRELMKRRAQIPH